MKSKTSFFNRTVFKKNMTLYWPIWVCYLLYGMVKVPGQLWSRLQQQTDMTAYARDYALYNSLRLEVDVAAIAIMAVVCGMALFGYLFTQKNAYMIHALPVTRGELYVTNMISGLCFLLIPQALVFLVTVVLCHQLDFFYSLLLKQHIYENTPLFVVGLADGYDSALELIRQITEEVFAATQSVDIRHYILQKHNESIKENRRCQ